jgi:hypothetical protein
MKNFNNNIGLITTVSNISLYKETISFFPENINLFVIDGSDGLFGLNSIKLMFKKLKKHKIKWLIMADEDVVFVNPNNIFDIIGEMEEEDHDVCGVRDGGLLSWRDKNPYILNTFFCIFNLEKIKAFYSETEFLENQYIEEDEFDDDLSALKYPYNTKSLFEDYYCFFLWLRRKNLKFKFLQANGGDFENDLETTTVFGVNNEILLYHTWYARTYGFNTYHTNRIDRVIGKGNIQKEFLLRKINYFRSYSFSIKKIRSRWYNRVINLFK